MQQSLSGLGKTLGGFLLVVFVCVSFMLYVFLQCVALALVTQVSRLQSADLIQCGSFSRGVQRFCKQMWCLWLVCVGGSYLWVCSFKQQFYLPVSEEIVMHFCWNYLPASVLAWCFKERQHTGLGSTALFLSIFLNQLSARSGSSQDACIFCWVLRAGKWDPTR